MLSAFLTTVDGSVRVGGPRLSCSSCLRCIGGRSRRRQGGRQVGRTDCRRDGHRRRRDGIGDDRHRGQVQLEAGSAAAVHDRRGAARRPRRQAGRGYRRSTPAGSSVTAEAAVNEEVTVAAGVAPSIETSPGAGDDDRVERATSRCAMPANLMQAVENVPGVSQVSEGQAAVPAVRGLARGRTLILHRRRPRHVGAPRRSERDVHGSRRSIEGVDVARGPDRSPTDRMRSAA